MRSQNTPKESRRSIKNREVFCTLRNKHDWDDDYPRIGAKLEETHCRICKLNAFGWIVNIHDEAKLFKLLKKLSKKEKLALIYGKTIGAKIQKTALKRKRSNMSPKRRS